MAGKAELAIWTSGDVFMPHLAYAYLRQRKLGASVQTSLGWFYHSQSLLYSLAGINGQAPTKDMHLFIDNKLYNFCSSTIETSQYLLFIWP